MLLVGYASVCAQPQVYYALCERVCRVVQVSRVQCSLCRYRMRGTCERLESAECTAGHGNVGLASRMLNAD